MRRAGNGLRLRIGQLEPSARAAALGLDPVADREEFALVDELLGEDGMTLDELATSEVLTRGRFACASGTSASNSGSSGRADGRSRSSTTSSAVRPAAWSSTLGSLSTREEQAVAAEAVLATLWRRRADREPVLIVIDEAHNVRSTGTGGSRHRACDRARGQDRRRGPEVRALPARLDPAAAEGARERARTVRQPPSMRMNSLADLAFVGDVFLRPFEPARSRDRLPPRRSPRRREDRIASLLRALRCPPRRGGRIRHPI